MKIIFILFTFLLLGVIGVSLPSCGGPVEVSDDSELIEFLKIKAISQRDSQIFLEAAAKSETHLKTMKKLMRVQNRTQEEMVNFAETIIGYSEKELEEKITFLGEQIYPNSCFGHSILEAMVWLDPVFALEISSNPELQFQKETEIMAFFNNGSYDSATREEHEANPYGKNVLGGVDPFYNKGITVRGVTNFLKPITGLNYTEVSNLSAREGHFVSQEERISKVKYSFISYPDHPVIIYSMYHALLIIKSNKELNSFSIHNPINASITSLDEIMLLTAFSFDPYRSNFGGDESEEVVDENILKLQNDEAYVDLQEKSGFPNFGVVFPSLN